MEASKESKRDKKDSKKAVEAKELPPQVVAADDSENGDARGKVKFKGTMQHEEAVHYLEAILNGLRKGKLQFKQGEERVALAPNGASVRVEVKAEHKSNKEKLSLELSWHLGDDEDEADDKLEVD
jgi:amphi-Trp domain-containing protein